MARGGAAVPPASAVALPGVGAVLAPPSSVAFAAPVVQAVAVSAGGGSYAGAVVFSRSGLWFFPFWGFCVPIGLVGLYDTRSVRGYSIHTLSLSLVVVEPLPYRMYSMSSA